MLFVYPAVFHKEEDAYWIEFPDLEGCHTYGGSITEVMVGRRRKPFFPKYRRN